MTTRVGLCRPAACASAALLVPLLALGHVRASECQIRSASVVAGHVQISCTDGRSIAVQTDDKAGQDPVDAVVLASGQRTVGWRRDWHIMVQGPHGWEKTNDVGADVAVWRDGTLTKLDPPGFTLSAWCFVDGTNKVAIHGWEKNSDDTGRFALFDSRTGKQVAYWDPCSSLPSPKWAAIPGDD